MNNTESEFNDQVEETNSTSAKLIEQLESEKADLERRLAVAREALAPFANYACDEPHVNEAKCHNCIARDALTLTAPKP